MTEEKKTAEEELERLKGMETLVKSANAFFAKLQSKEGMPDLGTRLGVGDCEAIEGGECTCAERMLAWGVAIEVYAKVFTGRLSQAGLVTAEEIESTRSLVDYATATELGAGQPVEVFSLDSEEGVEALRSLLKTAESMNAATSHDPSDPNIQ